MLKFLKLNLILCLLITSFGCKKAAEPGTEDSNSRFFPVVYQVSATRENKNFAWTSVTGILQMKINQTSDTEGTFIFFYSNYKEPQFVTNVCSGGIKGNVAVTTNNPSTTTDTGVYNPGSTYNGSNSTTTTVDLTDPNDPTKTIARIMTYKFNLAINYRNLDPACRPESDKSIAIYRFANGEIVMVNEYREVRMTPVITDLN